MGFNKHSNKLILKRVTKNELISQLTHLQKNTKLHLQIL